MWDAIVVGGGLSGLVAAIRAQDRGRKTLLISEGVGSLVYAAGVWDFGDFAELHQKEGHPYGILGLHRVQQGFAYFLQLCPGYSGAWQQPSLALTPLGQLRTADICAPVCKVDHLAQASKIILLNPLGLKDFFPEVVKGQLQQSFPQSEVLIYPFRTDQFEDWYRTGQSIKDTDYARFWLTKKGQEELGRVFQEITQLNPPLSGAAPDTPGESELALILPGLSAEFDLALQVFLSQAPFPVSQMTAFPPTASGRNAYDHLVRKFKRLGGEFILGSGVIRAEQEQGACTQVIVGSKGKESIFRAETYILAGGGVLGGGIQVTAHGAREGVFGLPLFVPQHWSDSEFLGSQPYAQIGIEVDEFLRPLDPVHGRVVLNNVRVVGRMLAHWDPWLDKCGAGVSVATGLLAGELA